MDYITLSLELSSVRPTVRRLNPELLINYQVQSARRNFSPPAGDRVGYLLRLCHDKFIGAVTQALAHLGVSMVQYRILWIIRNDNARYSQAAIASKLELSPNTVSRLIAELVKSGLVGQIANPMNRREKFVRMTNQGMTVLSEASELSQATQQNLLSHMPEHEQQELKRLLRIALRDQLQDP